VLLQNAKAVAFDLLSSVYATLWFTTPLIVLTVLSAHPTWLTIPRRVLHIGVRTRGPALESRMIALPALFSSVNRQTA
jgi:hypothetical protein